MVDVWLNASLYGIAVAVTAGLIARVRALDAAWRSRVWSAALAGLAFLTVAAVLESAASLWSEGPGGAFAPGPAPRPAPDDVPAPLVLVPFMPVVSACVLAVWASVASWRLAVLGAAIVRIRRAKQAAAPFPEDRGERLCAAAERSACLVISSRVGGASMLGFGRPMIAVPPAWLALDDGVLGAIVLHEIAHAERRDDLGELADQLLLAACWWHPAAWWMARCAEFEREAACDERAARVATPRGYARSLVTIAEALQPGGRLSLVPSSLSRATQLCRRVERVLDVSTRRRRAPAGVAAAAVAAVVAISVVAPELPVFATGSTVTPSALPATVVAVSGSQWPAAGASEPISSTDSSTAALAPSTPAVPAAERPRRRDIPQASPAVASPVPLRPTDPVAEASISGDIPVLGSRPFDVLLPARAGSDRPAAVSVPPRRTSPYRAIGKAVGRAGRWSAGSLSQAAAAIGAGFSAK